MANSPRAARRSLLFAFVAVTFFNVLMMPGQLLPGDPHAWIFEAQSIVTRGELAVAPEDAHFGAPGQYLVTNPSNGRSYSKYGLGSSLLILPPVGLNQWLGPYDRQLLLLLNLWYALASGILAVLLVRLAGRFARAPSSPLLFTVSCLFGTFWWFYLRAQSMELPLTIFSVAWFTAAADMLRGRRHRITLFTLWACAGAMVMIRPVFLLMLPASLAVFVLTATGPKITRAAWGAGACLLISLLLAMANQAKFGAWYLSGYHQWYPDLHALRIERLWHVIYYFIHPHYSILLTFLPATFAILAIRRFWREQRALCILSLSLTLVAMLVYASTDNWAGAVSEGPRYLLPVLPIAALPFVYVLDALAQPNATARMWLARLMVGLFLAAATWNYYHVNARLAFAWNVLTSEPVLSRGVSLGVFSDLPRGWLLWSLHASGEAIDDHPYMRNVAAQLPPAAYPRYRLLVMGFTRPDNWYWRYIPGQ